MRSAFARHRSNRSAMQRRSGLTTSESASWQGLLASRLSWMTRLRKSQSIPNSKVAPHEIKYLRSQVSSRQTCASVHSLWTIWVRMLQMEGLAFESQATRAMKVVLELTLRWINSLFNPIRTVKNKWSIRTQQQCQLLASIILVPWQTLRPFLSTKN